MKYPYIVLEGDNCTGKTTLSKRFQEKSGFIAVSSVPDSFKHLKPEMYNKWDKTTSLFFYITCCLASSKEIKEIRKKQPVIEDRSILSTIARFCAEIDEASWPAVMDNFEKYSNLIVLPDLIIHLEVDMDVYIKRAQTKTGYDKDADLKEMHLSNNKVKAMKMLFQRISAPVITINSSYITEEEVYIRAKRPVYRVLFNRIISFFPGKVKELASL